jgi:hypothetical protein
MSCKAVTACGWSTKSVILSRPEPVRQAPPPAYTCACTGLKTDVCRGKYRLGTGGELRQPVHLIGAASPIIGVPVLPTITKFRSEAWRS